jgi:predicted DNA binding protein
LMPMTKTELHRLVDSLPDESQPAVAILLRRAQDPVVAKLDAAPYDDEELTDEDLRAIKKARREPGHLLVRRRSEAERWLT